MYHKEIEIIEQIRSFHKQLSEFYSGLIEKSENQKVRFLLNYLCRHEMLREEFLAKYKMDAPKKEIRSWINKPSGNLLSQITECFKKLELKQSYTVDDVVKIALHFDDCLVKLYQTLAIEEETKRSHTNMFSYMMNKTKRQEKNLARDINWLNDI